MVEKECAGVVEQGTAVLFLIGFEMETGERDVR